ncbi:unnamed protein product, partial [Meganyctiphanes norvegica]|uniref:Sulfotransferase domain-containing protein n=1 Tax=Meganyctiphanes norvegica TaxID=48144 RepID=A0AAV2SB74_MEGNR
MWRLSGHIASPVQGEELSKYQRDFKGFPNGLIRLIPGNWLFPPEFNKFADKIRQLKFRGQDVLVMSQPGCAASWVQEMVWNMRNSPDLKHPEMYNCLCMRVPQIEGDILIGPSNNSHIDPKLMDLFRGICPGCKIEQGVYIGLTEKCSHPRTLATYLPLSLFNPCLLDDIKIVYVLRNPKDVALSRFNHSRLVKREGFIGNMNQFIQYFVDENLLIGSYWEHVADVWERKGHGNLHLIFYEDLKHDLLWEMKRLGRFLGVDLSADQVGKLAQHVSFPELERREVAPFGFQYESLLNMEVSKKDTVAIWKEKVGFWRGRLTADQEFKIDQWTKQNANKVPKLSFRYE